MGYRSRGAADADSLIKKLRSSTFISGGKDLQPHIPVAHRWRQGSGGEPSRPIVWPNIVDARWQIEAAPDEQTEMR